MSVWQKRDPVKDYFPLPNAVFHLGLVPGELAVYAYLLYCEDRQTYQCWPSYKTIGGAVGLSVNTVRKHVHSLVDKGLVRTESTSVMTQAGLKRNGNLLYTVLPFRLVLDDHYQAQLDELAERTAQARREQSRPSGERHT